jgi:hypothetical protein
MSNLRYELETLYVHIPTLVITLLVIVRIVESASASGGMATRYFPLLSKIPLKEFALPLAWTRIEGAFVDPTSATTLSLS